MSDWKLLKAVARAYLTKKTVYWMRNGDVISVCAAVTGSDTKRMAESAEKSASVIACRIGGDVILDTHVLMSSNVYGLQAISMVDIPWNEETNQKLLSCGIPQAV